MLTVVEVKSYLNNVFPQYTGRIKSELYVGDYCILSHGFCKVLVKIVSEGVYCEVLSHFDYDLNNYSEILNDLSDIYDFFYEITYRDYKNGNYA